MEWLTRVAGRRLEEDCEATLVVEEEEMASREVVSGKWFEVIVNGSCATWPGSRWPEVVIGVVGQLVWIVGANSGR